MTASLPQRLHDDMVTAMKQKDKERLSVLRMLLASVKDASIEKRAEPSDDEVLHLIQSYAKKREDAKKEAIRAKRDDLVAREEFELRVLQDYLPEAMDDQELKQLVESVVRELGASSMKDMGRVMKTCQERAQGRADGSRISALVKPLLTG
ncbi:MAG TPA: GatB/YqeY domain-containing protein [Candidatus Krumholzibacteria bacterium]|nr:GatB/YqeY domain-containing protein [Candidatus Krumholzibacteria bacterium]